MVEATYDHIRLKLLRTKLKPTRKELGLPASSNIYLMDTSAILVSLTKLLYTWGSSSAAEHVSIKLIASLKRYQFRKAYKTEFDSVKNIRPL